MSDEFDPDDPRPGTVLGGKYRVERVIGEGGMGVVLAATHIVLKERVALKLLASHVAENDAIAARFLREAQAAVRIKSPHVARATDVGTLDSGAPYMVMEYLEGTDLGSYLEHEGPLAPQQACAFALQTCEALAAAHIAGVIHRDIKPGNLFLARQPDGSEVVKVLDFGISKVASEIGGAALTQTKVSMGSPLYMSPEQMRSARSVDARADIWSLGVVLYEMLTGQLPFNADSMPQLCALVLEGEAPSLRSVREELPEALERVVHKCLERVPANRFSDVAELAAALAPLAGPDGPGSAQRCARIMEGAGMGKTVSQPGRRNSSEAEPSSSKQSDAQGTGIGADTDAALGRTQPAAAAAPERSYALTWGVVGGVVVVAAVALLASQTGENRPASGDVAPTPSVPANETHSGVSGPESPSAPSQPPAPPSASAEASASASAETSALSAPSASTTSRAPGPRPPSTATPAQRPRVPRPSGDPDPSVFDERL